MAVFDNGKWYHLRWQANLLAAGIINRIEVPLDWPDMRSMGSMDGAGIVKATHPNKAWRGLEFGLEVKSVSPYLFPRWASEPRPQLKHLFQVHRYLLSSGLDLFVVIYENKGTNEWKEWVVKPTRSFMRDSMAELQTLNDDIDNKTLHPQMLMCKARKGPHWHDCPFSGVNGTCEMAGKWPR
jgi:hypothetical protein